VFNRSMQVSVSENIHKFTALRHSGPKIQSRHLGGLLFVGLAPQTNLKHPNWNMYQKSV